MSPNLDGSVLDKTIEDCTKVQLPSYFNWLEFGNPSAPYSKHTIKAYKREIILFIEFLSENSVESVLELSNPIIRQYLSIYSKNGARPSTISQKLSCIDSFFEWLYLEGLTEFNPVSKYKQTLRRSGRGGRIESKIPSFLFPDEVQSIFIELNKSETKTSIKNRALLGVMLDTGIRASELGQLTLQDANNLLSAKHLKVTGKGRKERVVHSRDVYSDYLSDYIESESKRLKKGNDLLFITTQGNPIKQENLYMTINGLLKKIGVQKEQNGPHLLRHTAATMMLHEGRNIKEVQMTLGHSSIQTTSLYTHLIGEASK